MSGQLELDGARLHYEIAGSSTAGSGDPVTFMQGYTMSSQIWDAQFATIARRCQVIRYDVRLHTGTSPNSRAPTDEALDVVALMEHLGIASSFMVGCCQGITLALELALRFPARVRAVAAVPGLCPGGDPAESDAAMAPSAALSQRLNEIVATVLIITGALDDPDVQAQADFLAHGITRSRRHLIPDCGSLPHLNAPRLFNEMLFAFLKDNALYTDMM